MQEHILALLNAGHDVYFCGMTVGIYSAYNEDGTVSYRVEVADPLDDDTKEPLHETFIGCDIINRLQRRGDYWEGEWPTPEEAIEIYLSLCEWVHSYSIS